MGRKLHRSVTDKKPFGVCGGLSEYFNIDSNFFRIVFVLLTLFATLGLWIYLGLALFMTPDDGYTSPEYHSNERLMRYENGRMILGVCKGYSEYFDIDVVTLRIIVVLATLIGFGPIFYIISAFFMPIEHENDDEQITESLDSKLEKGGADLTDERAAVLEEEKPTETDEEQIIPDLPQQKVEPRKKVCIRRVKRKRILPK